MGIGRKLHTAVSRDTQIMYLNVLHNMEMVNGTVISEHILKQLSQEYNHIHHTNKHIISSYFFFFKVILNEINNNIIF